VSWCEPDGTGRPRARSCQADGSPVRRVHLGQRTGCGRYHNSSTTACQAGGSPPAAPRLRQRAGCGRRGHSKGVARNEEPLECRGRARAWDQKRVPGRLEHRHVLGKEAACRAPQGRDFRRLGLGGAAVGLAQASATPCIERHAPLERARLCQRRAPAHTCAPWARGPASAAGPGCRSSWPARAPSLAPRSTFRQCTRRAAAQADAVPTRGPRGHCRSLREAAHRLCRCPAQYRRSHLPQQPVRDGHALSLSNLRFGLPE